MITPDSDKSVYNHPFLMQEWDDSKNDILPGNVSIGSEYNAWWKCPKGHSYVARVNNRYHGKGCPYCAGKRVYVGFNDLQTMSPLLAEEWDFEKNSIQPTQITIGSNKKVWWKCRCGNSYLKSPHDRSSGRGCPICGRRSGSSFPEQCVFFYVKSQYPETINRDISVLESKFELDIFIPNIMVGIEYDGAAWHNETTFEHEKEKYVKCQSKNVQLIRIREKLPNGDIHEICDSYVICEQPKDVLSVSVKADDGF